MTSSAIRELLKLVEDPDMISFAGGMPAPELFPREELERATIRVLAQQSHLALQYGATEGCRPLRELRVRHMARYGIEVGLENVLVTTGSQQTLDLIGKLLLNPGDRVATEEPTYLGALQAFTAYQAEYLPVPIDEDGMRVDLLEDSLRAAPKFVYVLPNFQNPGGVTLSLPRRRRLVELAAHYGTPIVEDDPYGQLRYDGTHLPPLVKLDADLHAGRTSTRAPSPRWSHMRPLAAASWTATCAGQKRYVAAESRISTSGRRSALSVIRSRLRPRSPHSGQGGTATASAGLTEQHDPMSYPRFSSRASACRRRRAGSRQSFWSAPSSLCSWCIQKLGVGGASPSDRTPRG
jgi:2-aminoadipate transaminase